MAVVTWLVQQLSPDKDGSICVQDIFDTYRMESLLDYEESDDSIPIEKLGLIIKKVFKVKPKRKEFAGKKQAYYPLSWKNNNHDEHEVTEFSAGTVISALPAGYMVKQHTDSMVEVYFETDMSVNNNRVCKTIVFEKQTVSVFIRATTVDLKKLLISEQYKCCSKGIQNVCKAVEAIIMCKGCDLEKQIVELKENYMVESMDTSQHKKKIVRSKFCKQIVPFTFLKQQHCYSCKTQQVTYINKEPEKTAEEKINKLMPTATDAMITLIMSQITNINNDHATQNRWDRKIMNECLNWYTRSPLSYIQIRQSGLLLLPSPSMLLLYKNSITHSPGVSNDIFQWMEQEAVRMNLPDSGRIGGILLDEMSIQQKIEIKKTGKSIEMVGFVEMGSESDDLAALREGKKSKKIGTHVLQFLYQGLSVFRFPFAHFVSDQVNACELYIHVWDSVKKLSQYGFQCKYICMDGAVSNRSFMSMHFADDNISKMMKAPMPCNPTEEMMFMMDPSHTFKKIRNNLLKSGTHDKCTRLLKLPSGKQIQWQMWIDAYIWDKTNPIQIHRILTNEHIFPSQSEKMRNKYAEDVLNTEMLNLMESYKQHLGASGTVFH